MSDDTRLVMEAVLQERKLDLRTPLQWAADDGLVILDPDGWRYPVQRKNVRYPARSFQERIDRTEYIARLWVSTIRPGRSGIPTS